MKSVPACLLDSFFAMLLCPIIVSSANYLSVEHIYLYDNSLLRKPLNLAQFRPRLFGHLCMTAGLNSVYELTRIAGRLSWPSASGWNHRL